MWMLLPLVVYLAAAFPANWNGTTSCPRDALYTSLVEDGGEFCSSVLEGNHCGGGYSTPAEYVSYNQTRIASYCECILTSTDAIATATNSSRETMRDSSITVTYPDSWTTSSETSASVGGRPGPGRSYETTSTEESDSTGAGSWNQTQPVSSSFKETTEGSPRTSPYTNTTGPATETPNESLTSSRNSWNSTISESLTITRGPVSLTFSRIQNRTSDTWPTLPLTRSGNQTQTLQSNTGVTSQPASITREPGMTRSRVTWNTTSASLPWPIPGNSTSSPSESNTGDVPRPTGIPASTFTGWNSSISIPSISISGTGTFVPFPTVPFPTISVPTDSGISSESGRVVPSWNDTTSSSRGNDSVPSISISRTGTFVPFPTFPAPSQSSSADATSGSSYIPDWNVCTIPNFTTTKRVVSNTHWINIKHAFSNCSFPQFLFADGLWSNIKLESKRKRGAQLEYHEFHICKYWFRLEYSEVLSSVTQSGDIGWNITSSISGFVSLPTISLPTSDIPIPFPSLPFPTDSSAVASKTESGSIVPGDTTGSAPGSIGSVTSPSSPVATAPTSGGISNGSASPGSNATATGVPEFPAANFTHVTRTAALSQETCHTLAGDPQGDSTRRALLYNARLREENVSIPIPYIESVEFESDGLNPLYLTVRDEEGGTYFVDISRRGQLSVADPAGYLVTLDAEGIHFSGSNCTYDISITVDDMYEQIADLAGVQCAALKRQKRAEDLNFSQVLYLHDQCGNVVDRSLRQYPQLLVGDTVCADVAVDEDTGRWDFDCTFPGSESGSMRCQWAIKNSVIDFITTDPFGGSCPDLSTVVTTLEESAQDIVDPTELRKDLVNQGLRTERAKQEADAAVLAYTRLWAVLGAFFSKSTESSTGALEEYIDVYNTHRSFENDICHSLHEGEIPLNLTLIAGVTHIPAITTLNWAPESTRPYNITVQDSSRIACCPNGSVAEGEGDTCAYPREAVIQGTGCVCDGVRIP
ncbi:hypothetical protein FSARC_2761 [Fusarium sarcochroum]|uniref:Uncharacterized protein n=1 Tax=Fusarium sarcochroum TaxID=1208366 RepID=A0A8H4U603_9HYPO|nr:hypothetical protein FSARC_2761 [Fusarium sarcochroum]